MLHIAISQKEAEVEAAHHELVALQEELAQVQSQISACESKKALREQELAYLKSLPSNPVNVMQQWQESLAAMQQSGIFAFPWLQPFKR
jgi:septal ring factor EnvC (AmiA/AmiB activator)